MGFSKYTLSALAALMVLADEPQRRFPARVVSQRTRLSPRSLLEVMHTLCVAGLVDCFRGVKGGFQLSRPPLSVTLLEIVEAIEGPLERDAEAVRFVSPRQTRMALASTLYDIAEDTSQRLVCVTLADLRQAYAA